MNRVARKWSSLLASILALTFVLSPILLSMAVPLTEAKGSRGHDLRGSGSRNADFNVTEEVYGNSPFALLNSQSLFDFSKIKRSIYTVSGSRLEIGIEWAEGHDFDIWCGQTNSYEPDCDNHEFQVDLGHGITIDKISSIDMWEEYLTIHIELGENVVQCNQVINVSYQPSGRSSMGDPPDVPFSIEVLPVLDWHDQYDLQIKIKQDYLSYVEFMDSLKSLNLLEWYLTYINDLRVSEDGQYQLEFRIKPKLECLPSLGEHSIDLKVYTTDQYSLKLTPDQLKFAESDSDSLTLTFSNENSSDYQEFSIVAVDDEWAEKSSIAFMYFIVENENKIIENIGDLGDVTPFLVSAIFLEDNDEVIQVQPSSTVIESNALQKFSFSLKAPLDEVSDTYVLVTLQGDEGRLLDPSYAEESNANGDVEGFVRDYILYKISDDTWGAEEYTFFVQTMDEGNANLHFLTFNDEFLNIVAHSFDSLFANGQKYLSGQFPKLTDFNFNSPINCSANQDCIFSLLPHFFLFHLVNEWVNSFMDLDDFLTEIRQEESQFNTFISHYPFPDEFNFFQLFDDIGGIEFTMINYMQFKIRDSSDPYLGIKHTERIELRLPGSEESRPTILDNFIPLGVIPPCTKAENRVINGIAMDKSGYIYLAPSNAITSKEQLEDLVNAGLALKYADKVAPYQHVNISFETLTTTGTYYFYAVDDTANNLVSEPSKAVLTLDYLFQTDQDLEVTSNSVQVTTTLTKACPTVVQPLDDSYVVVVLMKGNIPVAVQYRKVEDGKNEYTTNFPIDGTGYQVKVFVIGNFSDNLSDSVSKAGDVLAKPSIASVK